MNILKLKGKMVENGYGPDAFAERIGIDRSTLYRKFSCGEKFTIGEAQKIKEVLDLSKKEASEIFFD
jgi:predicted transcriptional regulator